MAYLVQAPTIALAWSKLLSKLIQTESEVSPRGMKTREILNVTLEVTDGLNNIFVNDIRDLNYRFMVAEWLWIQGGLNDVETLATYNSVMRQFSDDQLILSGAYGPRLWGQWPYILETLRKPSSRQAVATIWTPNPPESKDVPCTISLQWFVRDGKLHTTVNMRSSDVWLGLPYDFFTFSQLSNTVASQLMIPMGSVTMNLGSSHLYETNREAAISAWYEGSMESVRSPQILPTLPPSKEQIKTMLDRTYLRYGTPIDINGVEIPQPWSSYAMSLFESKQHCLEVIRGLDPSRSTKAAK